MKKLIIISLISVALLASGILTWQYFAQETNTIESSGQEMAFCPVSESTFPKNMAAGVREYKGKTYYLCCSGCINEFKNNSAKYINKIEGDMNAVPQDDLCSAIQSCHG